MKNVFESIVTQMTLKCDMEMITTNMFESLSTQMKLKCGDEKLKKNKFESISTQMMKLRRDEICFPMNNSVNGLLGKYANVNVLQLVIDEYLAQKLPPKQGGYNVKTVQLVTHRCVNQKLPRNSGGGDMNLTRQMSIIVMMKIRKQRGLLTCIQRLLSQNSLEILQFVIPLSGLYRHLLLCSAWVCFILEGSKIMKAWEGERVHTCMYRTYVDR